MIRSVVLCVAVLAGLAAARAGPPPADPEAVADVKAGRRTEANAAWWGFDAQDATAALQGAIDSGARRVVVPNVGQPWIVRPIFLRSDQEVVFEKGVEIVARPGAFPKVHDALVTAENCRNIALVGPGATLRMQKPEYTEGEWRHALSLRGCSNVRVEGLVLRDSGGDGIYVGHGAGKDGPAFCSAVHIKGVTCDNNRRQGISVITARDLLIEDCTIINTQGTAPQAGIDFEPNGKDEQLVRCVVRRCRIEDNRGAGITLYLAHLDGTSEDVSVRVEDCRIGGSGRAGLQVAGVGDGGPGGLIEFVDCQVKYGGVGGGLALSRKSPKGARARFTRCTWTFDPAAPKPDKPQSERSAILFYAGSAKQPQPVGGVEFDACTVLDPRDLPAVKAMVPTGLAEALQDIRGTINVKGPGAAADLGGAAVDLKVLPAR